MHTEPHAVFIEDNSAGNDTEQLCAYVHPASDESVMHVMAQPVNPVDCNGRSEWLWVRLQDGTLILGVFPRGDTYTTVEKDAEYPL